MPELDEYRGVSKEDMQKQHEDQKNQEKQRVSGQDEAQKQQQQETEQNTQELQGKAKQLFNEDGNEGSQQKSSQKQTDAGDQTDADEERKRNINTLQSTFGVDFEQVPDNFKEEALKMAKSVRESQGKFTEATQERSELQQELQKREQVLGNLNEFLQKNQDVKRMIEKRMENPEAGSEPTKGQPNKSVNQGQLTEQQLIDAGYLDPQEVEGADEITRRQAKAKAELDYYNDQKVDEYQKKVQQVDQQFQQQKEKQRIKELNKQRQSDGIDRFVAEYGVDLTELGDETIQAVQRRATRILDPQDDKGRLIDEDAYYDALRKELAIRNKLPQRNQPSQANMSELENTGVSVNRRQQTSSPNSVEELLEKKERERWASLKNTRELPE